MEIGLPGDKTIDCEFWQTIRFVRSSITDRQIDEPQIRSFQFG